MLGNSNQLETSIDVLQYTEHLQSYIGAVPRNIGAVPRKATWQQAHRILRQILFTAAMKQNLACHIKLYLQRNATAR